MVFEYVIAYAMRTILGPYLRCTTARIVDINITKLKVWVDTICRALMLLYSPDNVFYVHSPNNYLFRNFLHMPYILVSLFNEAHSPINGKKLNCTYMCWFSLIAR